MKLILKSALILVSALGLLPAIQTATAATYKPKVIPIAESYGQFNVVAEYELEKAFAGSRNLELKVIVSTIGSQNIELKNLAPPDDKIKVIPLDKSGPVKDGQELKTEYLYRIEIAETANSYVYKIKMQFQYPGKDKKDREWDVEDRELDLNVGVRSKGELKAKGLEFFKVPTSRSKPYTLSLTNNYFEYSVNIHRIEVETDLIERVENVGNIEPKPIIEGKLISFDPPLRLKPKELKSININFKTTGMSFSNFIIGFDDSKLKFTVIYDDNNDRTISDFIHEVEIKAYPHDGVLITAMLIGVLIGTGVKFYLENLHKAGVITKKSVAWFVTTTIVVGVVITIIAWAGEIQIKVFNQDKVSYDRPVVIFLIGLIGALGGVHFLYNWLKRYLPQNEFGNLLCAAAHNKFYVELTVMWSRLFLPILVTHRFGYNST